MKLRGGSIISLISFVYVLSFAGQIWAEPAQSPNQTSSETHKANCFLSKKEIRNVTCHTWLGQPHISLKQPEGAEKSSCSFGR